MMKVQNLSQLKKALQCGAEYCMVAHRIHPEYIGLVRVVNKVQTNCVYSKIKDQPDHKYSQYNGGLGIRMDFMKTSHYEFGDTVKVYCKSNDKTTPDFEFEILKAGTN